MADLPLAAQEHIAGIMQKIRLSASLQKKLLGLMMDLAGASGNNPDAPLRSPEVTAIVEDSRLSPFQRGEKIYEILYRLRNPRLSRAADRFQSKVKKLNFPGPVRLRAHPFFEERGLHVEFDAPDAPRFRELTTALHQAVQSPDFDGLFVLD
jgi:hypothetical protein